MRWGQNESDDLMKPYFYHNLTKAQVFAGGYISTKSGHSKGSTLDMTLLHKINGTDVDFGCGFDFFGEKAHLNYSGVTNEQPAFNHLSSKFFMEAHKMAEQTFFVGVHQTLPVEDVQAVARILKENL